jgi:hypothetical protein
MPCHPDRVRENYDCVPQFGVRRNYEAKRIPYIGANVNRDHVD